MTEIYQVSVKLKASLTQLSRGNRGSKHPCVPYLRRVQIECALGSRAIPFLWMVEQKQQEYSDAVRIALLSTIERDPMRGRQNPAFTKFAGVPVIQRQLDLALALGCERIACLSEGIGPEVIALQHRAEHAGAKFVAMRDTVRLSGLVTASDELLVMASAVLPDESVTERNLAKPAVLAFPAESAVEQGYERIDPEFAWSGMLLTHGAIVEKLAELPIDSDASSALMRLSLQSGVKLMPLERRLLDDGLWHLEADHSKLVERERRWIASQREQVSFLSPGLAIAERTGARLARDVVGKRSEKIPAGVAVLSGIFAPIACYFGVPVIGFALLALMAMALHVTRVVFRVSRKGRAGSRSGRVVNVLDIMLDPIFVLCLVIAAPNGIGWFSIFVPLVLIGLLRLGALHGNERWQRTYSDRILLALLLVPAAFFGYAIEMAAAISLLVLFSRFVPTFRDD